MDRALPLTRRTVLAAGAGAASLPFVAATPGLAAPRAAPAARAAVARLDSLPTDFGQWPIAVRSTSIAGTAFRPAVSSAAWQVQAGVLQLAGAGTVEAPFTPANGDDIVGLTAWTEPAGTVVTTRLQRVGAAATETFAVPSHRADPEAGAYVVSVDLPAGVGLRWVKATWFPPMASIVLIEPRRVWDSRTADGYLVTPGWGAGGKLEAGKTLEFNLDGVVPRYIVGVLVNVTLDATEGAGYVVVWPGTCCIGPGEPESPTVPPTSTANWYGPGQTVANLAVSRIGGEAGLAVTCGGTAGARTHLIVDVLGYLT